MVYGDTPYMVRGGQQDYKRIFYSDQNRALTKPVTLLGGFGVIPGGTVLGIVTESTNRKGYYVPYVAEKGNWPDAGSAIQWPGITYVTAALEVNKICYVEMEESYRLAVGDHLAATDTDGTVTDVGAITAIDRTSFSHIAKITVTNNFAVCTLAKGAGIWIQTKTADPHVEAKGFLLSAVDTGEGENSKGAQGSLILSNAVLYKGNLKGHNSDVDDDIGTSSDGKYVVLK
jgi:hypothetical protein